MAYPPPPSGYPYPPNQQQSNIGFSRPPTGEGPAYSLYPQGGGGFPCPPSIPSPSLALYPGVSSTPPAQASSYPLPPSSTSAPYLPQSNISSSPYPPQYSANLAQYPPQANSAPFSQYPPQANSAPFSQYSPQANSAPFSQHTCPNTYPGSGFPAPSVPLPQDSPYPSSGSPYAPVSNYPNVSSLGASPNQQNVSTSSYQNNYSQSSPSSFSQSSHYAGNMWPYQERPTIRPAVNFDPSTDASHLRKAMKGFGTDEMAIIQVLGRRTCQQRQEILLRYQQSFGKDLVKDLTGELGGRLRDVTLSLMIPLPTYLAQQLNMAISGFGTNERTLIEIMCANDNNSLRNIKSAYQTLYRKPVEAHLRGDTSGYFGRLMVAMAAASRDETGTDPSLAPSLAQTLYGAGVKKLGTDETEFIRILSTYSFPLLRCVFEEYRKVSGGKTFENAIKSELSGDFRDGMLAIYECINNRAAFFAHYLNDAMKGLGTHDDALIRIIVSRSEIDMGNIKDEFHKKYGKRLEDAVSSETSGDYKKILLALIQG